MNKAEIPYDRLKLNTKYLVKIEDCCMHGDLILALIGMKIMEEYFEEFHFDVGTLHNTGSQKIEFYET